MNINKISPALKRYTPGEINRNNRRLSINENFDKDEEIEIVSASEVYHITNGLNVRNISNIHTNVTQTSQNNNLNNNVTTAFNSSSSYNSQKTISAPSIKDNELDLCYDRMVNTMRKNYKKNLNLSGVVNINCETIFKNDAHKVLVSNIAILNIPIENYIKQALILKEEPLKKENISNKISQNIPEKCKLLFLIC